MLDLGSNSARVVIWSLAEDNSYRITDKAKEMVRLSEGMTEDYRLKPDAMSRTLEALKVFSNIIKANNVSKTYAVATAALRRAENAEVFLSRIKGEAGLDVEVISGLKEATYVYYGVLNTLPVRDCILIDTGGASTELVLVRNRKMVEATSIPIGAIVLSEQFLKPQDSEMYLKLPPSPDLLKRMYDHVEDSLRSLKWLKGVKCPVVGLGGSIRSLGKVCQKQSVYPLRMLHGYDIPTSEVVSAIDMIELLPVKKRPEIPGFDKKRADTIVGGLAPLRKVLDITSCQNVVISESGLREGVFYRHLLDENPVIDDILEHSIENILKLYRQNINHCRYVRRLSESMFNQLRDVHKVDEVYKKPLLCAAMLHDIGLSVDYENHEQHGFYLMLAIRLYGLTHKELVLSAFLVGMHRLEEFKVDWRKYDGIISERDYESIKKLSIILKIAENLDRSEDGFIESVKCLVNDDSIQIMLKSRHDTNLQAFAVSKNRKAFAKMFDRKLEVM